MSDKIVWVCEWCCPSDFPAEHPERCRIIYCPKDKCRTWHYPVERIDDAEPSETDPLGVRGGAT